MPQLDKLSFATQYFWLTLFFFGLYFLTVNFFVISVFKNLKLRNIIYRIWYLFVYHFDYIQYHDKKKKLADLCFNVLYANLYINFVIGLKINFVINRLRSLLNKSYSYTSTSDSLHTTNLNLILSKSYSLDENLISNLNNIDIDEI